MLIVAEFADHTFKRLSQSLFAHDITIHATKATVSAAVNVNRM